MEQVERLISEQGEREITLEAAEGDQFVVTSKIAFQSNLILEALGETEPNYLQVHRVRAEVLKAVIEFMTHHATVEAMHEIPDTLEARSFNEVCTGTTFLSN